MTKTTLAPTTTAIHRSDLPTVPIGAIVRMRTGSFGKPVTKQLANRVDVIAQAIEAAEPRGRLILVRPIGDRWQAFVARNTARGVHHHPEDYEWIPGVGRRAKVRDERLGRGNGCVMVTSECGREVDAMRVY